MESRLFLAFDLGAESGRTVLGRLSGGKIHTRVLTRFPNAPVPLLGHQYWNIYTLFEEVMRGLKAGSVEAGRQPDSLAVDTWGVDFGLLSAEGTILGLPFAYRDNRTQGVMEHFFKRLPKIEIYARTGVQFLPFNSLYQLFAWARDNPSVLASAKTLLFMPDLITFLLTGKTASEFTIASTSQLLNARHRTWDETILSALGVPSRLMPQVMTPATVIGNLHPSVIKMTGLHETKVIAAAGHDTAAAVAAVPASEGNWAYISSGTWSLLGVELPSPLISSQTLAANFTNEGGVEGTVRFLKNISGLWLLQQCRKEWSGHRDYSYDELTRMAGGASPFRVFIDPDCPDFLNPTSMPEAIRQYCLRTGQRPPSSPEETARAILESLALKYRHALEQVCSLTGKSVDRVHLIGGGSRNELLCQFTADASGLTVLAGPAEATAAGNIMIQALALGYVRSLGEIRAVIRDSMGIKAYRPARGEQWNEAYKKFRNVTGL